MSLPTGIGLCCQANLAPGPEPEVAVLAAQPPDDPPAVAVDLVDGPGVATRDDQVAVGGETDRVDVEVVVGRVRVARGGLVAVGDRHVVEAVPLEQHAAGGQVDLLDDPVVDLAVARATGRGEVAAGLVVGLDQRRVLRGQEERVLVGEVAVAGMHVGDDVVGGVGDHALAVAVPRPAEGRALPPGEDRAPLVALDSHVAGHLARRQRPEPHRPAQVVDDQRPCLLARSGRAVLGAEDDQARPEPGVTVEDTDLRRPQVGNARGARAGGPGVAEVTGWRQARRRPRPPGRLGHSRRGGRSDGDDRGRSCPRASPAQMNAR